MFFLTVAGPVASWLKAPALGTMLRWYSLTLLLTALFSQAEMLLNAKMDFRGVCWMYVTRQGLLLASVLPPLSRRRAAFPFR